VVRIIEENDAIDKKGARVIEKALEQSGALFCSNQRAWGIAAGYQKVSFLRQANP
jgi:hypothetical protein